MQKTTNLLLVCLLLFLPVLLQGQASKSFPKNLKQLSMDEVMALGPDAIKAVPTYDVEGKLIDKEDLIFQKKQIEYTSDYYADSSGKLVAIKLRKRTDEEIAFIQQFLDGQAKLAALIGTPAKIFETVDIEGNKVNLEDLKGTVVAINFWFIGCKPCITEMPELNEIVSHFEGENVKFLAIATDKKDELLAFEKKRDFDYMVIPDGRDLAKLYEISGYPTHCIIDQQGNIAYFKSGYSPKTASELTKAISALLDK